MNIVLNSGASATYGRNEKKAGNWLRRLWQWRGTREPAEEESGQLGAGGSSCKLISAAIQQESEADKNKDKVQTQSTHG